jgi:NADH-quinone oxidoreductase subunit B
VLDMQEKIQRGGTTFGSTGLPELVVRESTVIEKRKAAETFLLAGERGDEDRFGYRIPGGPAQLGSNETS